MPDILLRDTKRENEQLPAENERLKAKLELADAVIAGDGALITGLKAELAEAKKDAERYRWMRDVGCATYKTLQTQWRMSPKQCDAAIDEAMKGK